MANYATLKAAISQYIKQNGNKEITGVVMQTTLLAMVDSMASGYTFAGVATPSTSAGTPDENVFWIGGAGSYSNFGATTINVPTGCIGIFQYNGSFTNTVVYVGGTVDISALSHTAYASLSQALGDLPEELHIGGISVQYQDSSTGKYVKYRLMTASWSTTENDWQRVDVRILNNSLFIGDEKTNIKQDTRYLVDGGRNLDISIEIGVDNTFIYTGGYIDSNNAYAISKPFVLKCGDTLNITNISELSSTIAVLSLKKDDTKYYPRTFGNSTTSYSIDIICDGEYYLCYKKESVPNVSVQHTSDVIAQNIVSSLNEINSVIRNKPINKDVQGERYAKYISIYNVVNDNTSYIISRPFFLHKGDIVKLTDLLISNAVSALSLFKDDAYINKVSGNDSVTEYEYTVDEDGIYYVSYNFSNSIPKIEIKECIESEKQKEFEKILIGEDIHYSSQNVAADQVGKYIYTGGFVDSNNSYTISQPISVKAGDIITVKDIKKNSDIVVLISSQIENSTTRYNELLSGTTDKTEYTFKATIDMNIVLTYVHSYGLPKVTITKIGNKGLYTECRLKELYRCFSTCICVGDSVTHGVIDDYPNAYAEEVPSRSYPTQLAKITGWNVTNAGKGGITAKGWFSTKFNNYTYTDYQVCLIEMCYNQLYTDTLETDVVPYEDYNDYADTETGNLCKIIKGILTQNPNILIVMILSPRIVSSAYIPSYEVYKKIADYYNLPLIDLTKGEITDLNADCYHGTDSDGVLKLTHFNALGYMAKADVIAQMFNEAMLAVPRKSNNAIYG